MSPGHAAPDRSRTPDVASSNYDDPVPQTIEILRDLGKALCRTDNPQEIYDSAAAHLRQAFQTDWVLAFVLHGRSRWRAARSGGFTGELRKALETSTPWARTGAAEPILIADVERDEAPATLAPALKVHGVRALALVPFVYRDRLLGFLAVGDSRPRAWPADEVRLVQMIGNQIALVVARQRSEEERTEFVKREQVARAEAEAANRSKDAFLATLSHELRTPLNAIMGWARLLRLGKLDEDGEARALETIERNSQVQAQLIDDLLDISRITTGKLRLEVRSLELHAVLEASIEAVRPAAAAKSITIQAYIDPESGRVHADADRLQQVFWNLLSNAIKFTPEGGTVAVRLKRVDPNVQVTVSDNGIGIDAAFLPHVFERFRQSDAESTRIHGGLGLGLAIVKHLVELHGGTVEVASAGKGLGTTFTVRLAVAALRPHDPPGGHAERLLGTNKVLSGLRVLIVDDEPDAREMLGAVLENFGAAVSAAASAPDAFDLLQRQLPHVLVCDIGMPGEDGYSLIRKVRALAPDRGGLTPAVALTAFARPEDRANSLVAGFQLHVPKPVKPSELAVVVATLAGRIEQVRALDPSLASPYSDQIV